MGAAFFYSFSGERSALNSSARHGSGMGRQGRIRVLSLAGWPPLSDLIPSIGFLDGCSDWKGCVVRPRTSLLAGEPAGKRG